VWGKYGFGEVFKLEPAKAPGAAWTRLSTHDLQGPDGTFPGPGLAFDSQDNLFGSTLGTRDMDRPIAMSTI